MHRLGGERDTFLSLLASGDPKHSRACRPERRQLVTRDRTGPLALFRTSNFCPGSSWRLEPSVHEKVAASVPNGRQAVNELQVHPGSVAFGLDQTEFFAASPEQDVQRLCK